MRKLTHFYILFISICLIAACFGCTGNTQDEQNKSIAPNETVTETHTEAETPIINQTSITTVTDAPKETIAPQDNKKETKRDITTSEKVYASKKSEVYHFNGCRYLKKIDPGNLITFDSPEDAEAADYRACKNCGR